MLKGQKFRSPPIRACASCLAILFLFLLPFSVIARDEPNKQPDRRVGYLIDIAKEVVWPDFDRITNFYIEVIGRPSKLTKELEQACAKEDVRGKKISVYNTLYWRDRKAFHYPNIVYVTASAMGDIAEISKIFANYPVLIVCEQPYYGPGWMVSFVELEDKRGPGYAWAFNLNPKNIETIAGLGLSDRLRPYFVTQEEEQTLAKAPQKVESLPRDSAVQLASKPPLDPANRNTSKERFYLREIEESKRIIKNQDAMIGSLFDTISYQRGVIRHLRSREYFDSLVFSLPIQSLTARNIYTATADTYPREHPIARFKEELAQRISSREEMPLNTAPWNSPMTGYMILLSACFFSLAMAYIMPAILTGLMPYFYRIPAEIAIGATAVVPGVIPANSKEKKSPNDPDLSDQKQVAATTAYQLLADMLHDVRTPMNAIVAFSKLAHESGEKAENVSQYVEMINDSSQELIRKVNHIVMQAQIASGYLQTEVTHLRIRDLLSQVHELVQAFQRTLPDPTLMQLSFSCDPTLPKTLLLDGEKLSVLLESLILRQIRACPAGTLRYGCKQVAALHRKEVEFFVLHEMVGYKEELFSKSELSNEQGAQEETTLLTLKVAQGITKLMGSNLVIDKLDDEHTRVWFRLPIL